MGLFDIVCDQHGVEWQTKSFTRPSLDRYRVTEEGHLEKGEPLDLPNKYYDNDHEELFMNMKRIMTDGPRFAWTKHDFSGTIEAITTDPNGKLRESKFEFQRGILVQTTDPQPIYTVNI